MQSIFIIGEQRSGSNLLRLILNSHSDVFAPHPPHIIERIQPNIANYGDLNNDENFRTLIGHVILLIEKNPISWEEHLTEQQIFDLCRQRTIFEIFRVVMNICADNKEENNWVCKSNHNVFWQDGIEHAIEGAKYIYLYRDPRDVVLSFMKTPVGDKHPYIIADKWNQIQGKCFELKEKAGNRFFAISYEELITHAKETVTNICSFLEIDFEEKMLDYFNDEDARKAAKISQQWENVNKPILSDNYGKYKQLKQEELIMIESLCFDTMMKLGYDPVTKKEDLVSYSNGEILKFNQLNEDLKQKFFSSLDQSEIEVRKDLKQVLEVIQREVQV